MGMADVCRVCLCGRRRLHAVNNTVFQDTWERLTHAEFNTNDGRSLLVCYMCCAQLRRAHELMKRALTAEELFTDVINNNDSEVSRNTILFLASQTEIFNYKYVIKNLYHLDCNQSERNTVNEIKKESEEDNDGETNISIKEEEEDSSQEENLDIADDLGAFSDDESLLKKIMEREVQIVLERIDIGPQTRKRTLNEEAPQTAKRTKLDNTPKERYSLANSVPKSLSKNNCKASEVNVFKNLSASSNVDICKSKQIIKSTFNCDQVNKTSSKVNIPPKHKIQAQNEVVQNNKTVTSEVCYSNAENEIFKQCLPKSLDVVAPNTSLDRSDEGNKTNNTKKKVSGNELSCHICQYKCVTKNILNIHLHKHTGEKPYKCDLCDYRCTRKDSLRSHIKYKHTKEKNFSCQICQYKFVSKQNLNRHIRKHTGEKPYKCDLCDYRCSHPSCLRNHTKFKHTKEKNFSCQICQYKFVTKDKLNIHLRKHTGEKPYKCDLCDYRCSDPSCLRNHTKFKHTKEKNFSCQICQYKFVTKDKLNIHLRKHTGEKLFVCDLCDYRSSRKDILTNHIKYKHTKVKNFSCQICQYKFVSKQNLNRHIRKHTGEKPYKCDLCDYRCSDPSNLRSHIKIKHLKEKKFSCQICQYKFVLKNNLNRHLRKHMGEKPYKCDLCDYRCSDPSGLRNHTKFKHTLEKKFSCQMCQHKFVTKDKLNIHLRKHTGEKPYKCDLYDYRCARKDNLRSHIKFKHLNE